jgi:hypothetical protein
MVHAALLLLMLEAVTTDLVSTISLKRSTQKSSAIHKLPADYPIFRTVTRFLSVRLMRADFEPQVGLT